MRKLLFPEKEKETSSRTPDCVYIHRELAKPGVTMTLLNVITKIALIWSIPPRRSHKKTKNKDFFSGECRNCFPAGRMTLKKCLVRDTFLKSFTVTQRVQQPFSFLPLKRNFANRHLRQTVKEILSSRVSPQSHI